MGRVLGLDIGDKKTGIAISGPLNITAQSLDTVGTHDLFASLKTIIKERGITKIVVGVPYNMNGTEGPAAARSLRLAGIIKETFREAEVDTVDERLTTAQGEKVLLEADISRKKRKKAIDKLAAQLILQAYLDKCTEK